jgi:uncharacterized protein (UPF0335 family)
MNALTMRLQRGADGVARHVPALAPPPAAPKPRKKRVVPDPIKTNGESGAEQLRLFLERLERLHDDKQGIADDIKDVLAEAKGTGFDARTINTILKLRRMESHHREEADVLLETYLVSLGMK